MEFHRISITLLLVLCSVQKVSTITWHTVQSAVPKLSHDHQPKFRVWTLTFAS